jgi:hypothetical protein
VNAKARYSTYCLFDYWNWPSLKRKQMNGQIFLKKYICWCLPAQRTFRKCTHIEIYLLTPQGLQVRAICLHGICQCFCCIPCVINCYMVAICIQIKHIDMFWANQLYFLFGYQLMLDVPLYGTIATLELFRSHVSLFSVSLVENFSFLEKVCCWISCYFVPSTAFVSVFS